MDIGNVINVFLLIMISYFCLSVFVDGTEARNCPCSHHSLCDPIKAAKRNEIFVFTIENSTKVWSKFDWSRVTTVVMVGFISPELMCFAHSKGSRVVLLGNIDEKTLLNHTARLNWIVDHAIQVGDNHLDGINIDFESAIPANRSDLKDAYSSLVIETYDALKDLHPFLQITVDVAWSPDCIDLRCYNYSLLAKSSDFLFVMAYDEQSQIIGECIAAANSGLKKTQSGLEEYLSLGISADKLVLGVPWYGYMYPCITLQENKCELKKVPFRGVNCSDAAGRQYDYSFLVQLLKNSTTGRIWDNATESPFYNYMNISTGENYQIWYDDPLSLSLKYKLALEHGLLGIGMWHASALDYTHNTSEARKERKDMWDALPKYSKTKLIVKENKK